ncbi:MAG: SHOCT domain-containing protein [Pseudomonadota bacterium]
MTLSRELGKLKDLHAAGSLSNDEYAAAKAKLLYGAEGGAKPPEPKRSWLSALWRDVASNMLAFILIALAALGMAAAAVFFTDGGAQLLSVLGVGGMVLLGSIALLRNFTDEEFPTGLAIGLGSVVLGAGALAASSTIGPVLGIVLFLLLVVVAIVACLGDFF